LILSLHQNVATFFTQLGISVSGGLTVTENDTGVALFPAESLAVQKTIVVPIENKEPELGLHAVSTVL